MVMSCASGTGRAPCAVRAPPAIATSRDIVSRLKPWQSGHLSCTPFSPLPSGNHRVTAALRRRCSLRCSKTSDRWRSPGRERLRRGRRADPAAAAVVPRVADRRRRPPHHAALDRARVHRSAQRRRRPCRILGVALCARVARRVLRARPRRDGLRAGRRRRLGTLSVMVAGGVFGGIASRNSALPRLAMMQVALGVLPIGVGALLAHRSGAWLLLPPLAISPRCARSSSVTIACSSR